MAYNFRRLVFLLKKQAKQVIQEMVKVIETETSAYYAQMAYKAW